MVMPLPEQKSEPRRVSSGIKRLPVGMYSNDHSRDRLRQLRSSQNLTVREFADRIGKSPGYASRIETRDEVPNAELLCSIAEIYGISPEELLSLAKDSQLTRTK